MLEKILLVIALALTINKLANKDNETNLKVASEFIQSCSQLVREVTRFTILWWGIELVGVLSDYSYVIVKLIG